MVKFCRELEAEFWSRFWKGKFYFEAEFWSGFEAEFDQDFEVEVL